MGRKIKKVIITTGVVTLMLGSLVGNTYNVPSFGGITAYAAEGQGTYSWRMSKFGKWYIKENEARGGYLAGLVTDQSTGKTYYLNNDSCYPYGEMAVTNGTYSINRVDVYLEFDQDVNSGYYGAITSGLAEAVATGVTETNLASIPTVETIGNKYPATETDWQYKNDFSILPDLTTLTEEESKELSPGKGGDYKWHVG